ncbi:MAG TPA: hypothetical protein VGO29_05020 [Solirubrobacteraceae bacterium]|jgi:hypothetical protein|nr:hypothetical protein [Solirubrobacteraceae bacterium]
MADHPNHPRNSDRSSTFDVCLLLRAHAEARWLSNELTPVLREIEQRETISDLQLGAALAYLEVLWIEAGARARETEAARVELDALGGGDQSLPEKARRYHAAVRRLRDVVERRVNQQLSVPPQARTRSRSADRQTTDRPAG